MESGASPKFTPKKSTRARTTRIKAKTTTIADHCSSIQVDSEEAESDSDNEKSPLHNLSGQKSRITTKVSCRL